MSRLVSVIIAAFFMFGSAGCSWLAKYDNESSLSSSPTQSDTSQTQKNKKTITFALAYTSDDAINPYRAKTSTNLNISSLIFEGLTKIDNKMMPVPQLADSVDYPSNTTISSVLRSGAKFSDGSPVKADDVVYSFSLAKASENYKVLLSNVKSAKADGENTIIFTLHSPDPNSAACLSFPVLKEGSEAAPVGSGMYIFKDGNLPELIVNSNNPTKPLIKIIRLLDVPDGDAMNYALESGNISYYYNDLASGIIPQTTTASISVDLNSLVFIGINSSKAELADVNIRLALSHAINRADICANAFAGRARPALTPFNPSWGPASKIKGFNETEKSDTAVAHLMQAGYNNKSNSGKSLNLELLVGIENSFRVASAELIKYQFARVGIDLKVTELSHTDLLKRIKSGKFDLYIGEIRLSANMSLSPIFSRGGNASYGIKTQGKSAEAYSNYLAGELNMQQFTDVFTEDVPFIPLCWRNGIAAYNRSLSGVTATAFNAYYGIENWTYS